MPIERLPRMPARGAARRGTEQARVRTQWRGCGSLPLYPGMAPAEQDHVIHSIRELLH